MQTTELSKKNRTGRTVGIHTECIVSENMACEPVASQATNFPKVFIVLMATAERTALPYSWLAAQIHCAMRPWPDVSA